MKYENEFVKALEEHSKEDDKRFLNIKETLERMEQKLDNLVDFYQGMNFIGKFLVRTGIIAGAITAVILLYRTLLNK